MHESVGFTHAFLSSAKRHNNSFLEPALRLHLQATGIKVEHFAGAVSAQNEISKNKNRSCYRTALWLTGLRRLDRTKTKKQILMRCSIFTEQRGA
jgi:hypothetical protein